MGKVRAVAVHRYGTAVGASAFVAMAMLTACSPRTEQPSTGQVEVSPTDKAVRTNVTRTAPVFRPSDNWKPGDCPPGYDGACAHTD